MRIAIFGGSFNPPHIGHVEAAKAALNELNADKLIVVPSARPPHKELETGSPEPEERLCLSQLSFSAISNFEVSNIELCRQGIGYTVDTLNELSKQYPNAEFVLLMGTDMFLSFETWKDFRRILELSSLAVFSRGDYDDGEIKKTVERFSKDFNAKIYDIDFSPIKLSSTELRVKLRNRDGNNLVSDDVYDEIIKHRYYGAMPNLEWLRQKSHAYLDEKRIPHVIGCEKEAVRLAERWGADPGLAAEAGILHDITKRLKGPEQLILCEEYDIITDNEEKGNYKLLHSKTGAAFARDKFGITEEVYSAIYWHTTGRENMTLLEKIIYIADYIEPTRNFEGVDELRRLAYENIDAAVMRGLQMSLEELSGRDALPHINSIKALIWFTDHKK